MMSLRSAFPIENSHANTMFAPGRGAYRAWADYGAEAGRSDPKHGNTVVRAFLVKGTIVLVRRCYAVFRVRSSARNRPVCEAGDCTITSGGPAATT